MFIWLFFFLLACAHRVLTNTTFFSHYAQDNTKYYELDNTKLSVCSVAYLMKNCVRNFLSLRASEHKIRRFHGGRQRQRVSTQRVGELKISCFLGRTPCLKLSMLRSREYKIGAWRWYPLGAKREMLCKRCECV